MPTSIVVNGEVLDYHFFKRGDHGYNFFIGKILVGMVFKMSRDWSAVSHKVPCPYGVVNGFKTRHNAADFILQVCGYIGKK